MLKVTVVDPTARHLTKHAITSVARRLAAQGIRYLNLGGSEDANLYRFKISIGPSVELHPVHLIIGKSPTN